MGLIRVLSEHVANQIAAGEVVDRPASAVKELVENAVDSGASKIDVRVNGGGLELILVQDNGSGIASDDIENAFIRHATSKLRALSDFSSLKTLGFRGEALPSIAAVSKILLRTKVKEDLSATEVVYEGGQLTLCQPAGGPAGTKVQVTDLYYNTPARLKFVRSLHTETTHIVDVVSRAAIARPDIAFSLYADDRLMLQTSGDGQLVSVFAAIYGTSVAKLAMAVVSDSPDYTMKGLASAPEHARSNRNVMWFSINGRPIRSPMLVSAVLDGYGTSFHKGRFPIVYMALEMDPSLVDVNVHPGKLEVRFSEEKDVRNYMVQAVREALEAGAHIPEVDTSGIRSEPRESVRFPANDKVSSGEAMYQTQIRAPMYQEASKEKSLQAAFWSQQPITEDAKEIAPPFENVYPQYEAGQDSNVKITAIGAVTASPGELRAVAQVLNMFVVAEDGESVYLIDQHAAHERVLYERFRAKLHASTVRDLELLVPMTFELRPHETDIILRQKHVADSFGLGMEAFGESSILVRSIPNIWEGLDAFKLIRDVFDDFLEEKEVSPFLKLEDKVIMSACKAAIKAHQRLSLLEMDALLKALSTLEHPFTCPHGRPTAVKITRSELERQFLR